jgi:Flp pilus assembly protein TadG
VRVSCTRKRERGMTLILVAMCIFVFIGIAALAVDVGVLYTARTSAQHAADAGALAGATTFNIQPTAAQPQTATDAAVRIANQNNVLGTSAGITAGDVTVDYTNRRVTVTVPRTAARGNAVTLFFARIFGLTTSDIAATATAEASLAPTGGRCIKPIYIPNTALSQLGSADSACKATPLPQIMFDPTTGTTSAWMQTLPNQGYGNPIILKPNSPPGALDPSQYYTLDLGSGANTYQCVWSSCMSDPACGANQSIIQCGSQYPVKTGNMVGPTKQGVDNLICGPSGNCNTNPADTWGGIGDYISPTGQASTTSRGLTIAPVWDDCANQIMPGTNGQVAKVIGFVEIFVSGIDKGTNSVTGYVVNPLGCNGSGSTGTGPFATPIRLVQAPPAS